MSYLCKYQPNRISDCPVVMEEMQRNDGVGVRMIDIIGVKYHNVSSMSGVSVRPINL